MQQFEALSAANTLQSAKREERWFATCLCCLRLCVIILKLMDIWSLNFTIDCINIYSSCLLCYCNGLLCCVVAAIVPWIDRSIGRCFQFKSSTALNSTSTFKQARPLPLLLFILWLKYENVLGPWDCNTIQVVQRAKAKGIFLVSQPYLKPVPF